MKVLVFGASGIVGQHLRLQVPDGVTPIWYRHHPDPITFGLDLSSPASLSSLPDLISAYDPDVVINLAGESSSDKVEDAVTHADTNLHLQHCVLNVELPIRLAAICQERGARYIHISSQAVFGGDTPPYFPTSIPNPNAVVNEYGRQKITAEQIVRQFSSTTVVRLTFILGIRPLPLVGRKNPLESMFDGSQTRQVDDRWFSPLFATDAAAGIWAVVQSGDQSAGSVIHLGIPEAYSRYELARKASRIHPTSPSPIPVKSTEFPALARRPINTTYADASTESATRPKVDILDRMRACYQATQDELVDRALEIALFLDLRHTDAISHLRKGFGELHSAVTADFNSCQAGVDDRTLLDWYRSTVAYIWELTVYHMDGTGFNYSGMCKGIADRLLADSVIPFTDPRYPVLCLGDGIGDLTLSLRRRGLHPVYHDLLGSRTADYASFRSWRQTGKTMAESGLRMTAGWDPGVLSVRKWGAVASLDYLEHVVNVPLWIQAIYDALVPGGLLVAQNAFAIGSGADGSMPMHLACNDKWEKEWDPFLFKIGFEQISSNWYRKPASA